MPAHSTYTQELADFIIDKLWDGWTIPEICKAKPELKRRTITDWCKSHPEFGKAYEEAMLGGCYELLDETKDIADDTSGDYVQTDKGPVFNPENVQRAKLRIWTRHELIKRKRRDVFGDKVDLNHGGSVGFSLRVRRRSDVEGAES